MKDEWILYEKEQENGSRWIIKKNIYPFPNGKEKADFPVCIYFTVHYKPYTDEGFPAPEDNDAFESIEDKLSSICSGNHSIFVATVFMPKLKDFIIYTSNPDMLSDEIEPQVKQYRQFKFEFGGNEDPDWGQYDSFAKNT